MQMTHTVLLHALSLMLALPAAAAEGGSPATRSAPAHTIAVPLAPSSLATDAGTPEAAALPTLPIPLTNVVSTVLDGTTSMFSAAQQRQYNLRIDSDQTNLSDYLRATYEFSAIDQKFVPTEFVKFGAIGVYNEPYFVKAVPAEITMTSGTQTLQMGQRYGMTSTASTVQKMELKAGQVLSFLIQSATVRYRIEVKNKYNEVLYDFIFEGGSGGIITDSIPIFVTGTHRVRFIPLVGSSVNFDMTFLNANRSDLAALSNGSSISRSYTTNLRDYSKYSVDLQQGQTLSVSDPSNSDIELVLVNERNARVAHVIGLQMLYEAPASGRYYLFINNNKGWGGSYTGSVIIE